MPRYDDDDDDDDDRRPRRRDPDSRPRRPRRKKPGQPPWLIPALAGGFGLLVCCPVGILAIFLLKPSDESGKAKEQSFSVSGLGAAVGNGRLQTNMKGIGLAISNFHDANMRFPNAATSGTSLPRGPVIPGKTLSWRVGILPYLEQDGLYRNLDPGGDAETPRNRQFAGTVVPEYADPGSNSPMTRMRAVVGPNTVMDTTPGRRSSLFDISDGSMNTIVFVQSTEHVPWMPYNEVTIAPGGPIPPLGMPSDSSFYAGFADGSVRAIRKTVDPSVIRAAVTRSGGDHVNLD